MDNWIFIIVMGVAYAAAYGVKKWYEKMQLGDEEEGGEERWERATTRKWHSSYLFKRSWTFLGWKITADMRRNDGFMGRFGGGWNWKIGLQAGGKTLLISLLVMDIAISKEMKTNVQSL